MNESVLAIPHSECYLIEHYKLLSVLNFKSLKLLVLCTSIIHITYVPNADDVLQQLFEIHLHFATLYLQCESSDTFV